MSPRWAVIRNAWMAAFAALGAMFCLPVVAQVTTGSTEEMDTVVVTGEQPGPGLWKVSKGEQVMWVLGSYGPLPKDMKWSSGKVEARIRESQQVLYPGNVNVGADIGILYGLTLIPAALKAGKIPGDRTLQDVLSAETYAKWLALRLKYIGKDDDIERWRPSIAIGMLHEKAFAKANLRDGPSVNAVVDRAAKQAKVRIQRLPDIKRTVKVEGARSMLKSAQKLDLPDVECFTKSLDLLEPDVERMKQLANAWSRGNVTELRKLYRVGRTEGSCQQVWMTAFQDGDSVDAMRTRKLLADIKWHAEQAAVKREQEWLAAAQQALTKNASTFAVLPMGDLVRPDGVIAKLAALGYTVEEPL